MKLKYFVLIFILVATTIMTGEIMNAQQVVSGFVLHNGTGQPIEGAEVFYYDEKGHLSKGSNTDSRGMFEFKTTIKPGKDIKITIHKHGEYTYTSKPKTVREEGTDFENIFLTQGPLGTHKVNGYVRGWLRNRNKGIADAIVSTYDPDNNRIPVLTDSTGYYEFFTRMEFGDEIEFRIEKLGYITKEKKCTLKKGDRHFNFKFIKKPTLCDGLFLTSGALAVASVITGIESEKFYDRYNAYPPQNYRSPAREKDYQQANKLHHWYIREGIGAAAFFLGGKVCTCIRKKNNKPNQPKDK